jgi:mono/diheme cytochrome c family protein
MVGPAPVATATTADIARGRTLYVRYCASCHGRSADGHGPVAPALKTPPADLRILSKRYGNPLPADEIARFIDGRADIVAHGPREMPVWGDQVWAHRGGKGNEGHVTRAIADLVAYLQSIQKVRQHASVGERTTLSPKSQNPTTSQMRLRYSGL